jgi:hypothetical protein
VIHREIDSMRDELQHSFSETVAIVQSDANAARDADTWERTQNNVALTKALERVADALDGVGNHLLLDRRERAAQGVTVEFLLRELVVTFSNPVPDGPTILAGTIDPGAVTALEFESRDGSAAIAPDHPDDGFQVGQAVEVRSRFQQRWVAGFLVAEILHDEDARRYRLLRRSDRELLPVTFDDTDLRAISKPNAESGWRENAATGLREDHRAGSKQEHPPLDVRLHRT